MQDGFVCVGNREWGLLCPSPKLVRTIFRRENLDYNLCVHFMFVALLRYNQKCHLMTAVKWNRKLETALWFGWVLIGWYFGRFH